VIFKRKT